MLSQRLHKLNTALKSSAKNPVVANALLRSIICQIASTADLPISFNLDVTGPDKFTICSGSTTPVTATYEAVVTPDATPVTYQWYVNGSAVPGANSATFVTTYTSADEGTTVVKCEATAGGTTEDGTVTTQILVKGP